MNLERPQNLQNAGAIAKIFLIDRNYIHTISRTGTAILDITLLPGRDWIYLYHTEQTAGFLESAAMTPNGMTYRVEISGFFPGDTEELREFLAYCEYRQFVVAVEDANGVMRVAGNRKLGLTLEYDSVVPAEMSGRRGSTLRLSGELPIPSSIWAR